MYIQIKNTSYYLHLLIKLQLHYVYRVVSRFSRKQNYNLDAM